MEALDGEKLAGVTVVLGEKVTTTLATGKFQLTDVQPGKYELSVLNGDNVLYSGMANVNHSTTLLSVIVGGKDNQQNLVENWSFEVPVSDIPEEIVAGWTPNEYSPTVTFSLDEEVVRSGKYSMRIVGTGEPGTPRGRVRQRVKLGPNEPGTPYRVTAYYKSEESINPNNLELRLVARSGTTGANIIHVNDGNHPDFSMIAPDEDYFRYDGTGLIYVKSDGQDSDGWNRIQAIFTTPEKATHVDVETFLRSHVGTVWWDDIVVVRLDEI